MSRPPEPRTRPALLSGLRAVAPGVALLLLLLVCLAGPVVAIRLGGPQAGIASAIVAMAVWVALGPRPLPGLLPGLLAIAVFVGNVGLILWCVAPLVCGPV